MKPEFLKSNYAAHNRIHTVFIAKHLSCKVTNYLDILRRYAFLKLSVDKSSTNKVSHGLEPLFANGLVMAISVLRFLREKHKIKHWQTQSERN